MMQGLIRTMVAVCKLHGQVLEDNSHGITKSAANQSKDKGLTQQQTTCRLGLLIGCTLIEISRQRGKASLRVYSSVLLYLLSMSAH
jgi:hypothetical protein